MELVDAALELIATRGVAALTTRSLADAVGLSSGAIFRHFASLEALMDAVVARVEAVLRATYPPPGLGPAERLAHFVEARSGAVRERAGILRLVVSEQFLLALPEASAARLWRVVEQTREFVLGALREGQAAGAFRADVEAGALAVVVMGTVQALAVAGGRRARPPGEVEGVRRALFLLLSPPPGPTRSPRSSSKRKKRSGA